MGGDTPCPMLFQEEIMNCVHLDFHTSPDIEGIGSKFDKKEFTRVIREANIDLVTVFAKCHHGYSYYPTKVGTMHPHLNFNLLREEIEAIHDAGAKAPIYITVGWSKKDADEHPEWHQVDFLTKKPLTTIMPETPDGKFLECNWTTLCPSGEYGRYLESITHEVCQNFDTSDGVFFDIFFVSNACSCESCRRGAIEMGLDPDNYDDARKYYAQKHVEMMQKLTGIVHSYTPGATVFYNSGGAEINRTEYHPYQTHYELEDLPTAWGGYDLMPLRAKFFEKYGKPYLGMTGKFHHSWGEFGGFKNKEALRYECADMLSVGASISVGDHLHPSGKIDESTYDMIGHAFGYVRKIEKYCFNTTAKTDLAIWMSHNEASDIGASKLLQIMHLEFDVIESGAALDKYNCIVLPDYVHLSEADEAALRDFVTRGGRLVASYKSLPSGLGTELISPSEYALDYIRCDLPDCKTPFLAYSSAYVVKSEGEVLAQVYEPYFDRTPQHFCGHKNTPNKTEPATYPALVRCGGVIYFAHPVFKAYNDSGNYILEQYVEEGINKVYDRKITTENLPSCARIRLREQKDDGSLALHLLYAPPINRGNVCLLEDFPTLHDVKITIKTDAKVKSVRRVPENESIPFTADGDSVSFTVPPFSLHSLIIIE